MMNKRSAPAEGKSPRVAHQSGHVVRIYGFKESLGGVTIAFRSLAHGAYES
jgi:hypothetical protein